jgi:broad specificity phosphatase PhoE
MEPLSYLQARKIYIRHAEKRGGNREGEFDPPLTEEGVAQATKMGRWLLERYGAPYIIICSPYLRCRQTLDCFMEAFSQAESVLPVVYDPLIGEPLIGRDWKKVLPHLDEETVNLCPIHDRNREQFLTRMRCHIAQTCRYPEYVLHITHGSVIEAVAKLYGSKIRYPDPLSYLHLYPTETPILHGGDV